ncbi:MAG: hypothetical protein GVY14_08545, partial [Spirochaetes bacterium]|nr:hypothetical protein [Spirochaetota bacterium]
MTDLVVLLVVLPLGGAAAALAAKLPTIARRPAAVRTLTLLTPVMLLGGAVALGFSYSAVNAGGIATYALGGWPVPLGIGLRLDGLAWLSSALVYGLSFLISLYIVSHREYGTEFYFFFMLLVAGMEGVVLTTDVFNMFVSFEIIAISAYVLIAYHREGTALVASFKYLILSSVGIFFFLFGVFVIYRELGTLALADIGPLYRAVEDPVRLRTLRFALVALVVGVGVRTAFIPFHTWLPEAHAYAPHPISALLSGVLIKVSFFAMVRIITVFDPMIFARLLLWIGAITAIVAVIWALSQRDVKKLLAYHSISQMGYVLAAIGAAGGVAAAAAGPGDLLAAGTVGNPLALPASVYHALNHGLFKSLLFLAVGTAVYLTGERDVYRMPGVGRRAPVLAALFAVGALSIAGVPGFNGYASKVAISTALDGSPAYLLLRLTAIGTAASFIKLSRVFRGGPAQEGAAPNGATPDGAGARAVPAVATMGMVVIALLCVATGLAPHATLDLLHGLLARSTVVGGGGLHGLLTRSTVVGGGGLPAMSPAFAPPK